MVPVHYLSDMSDERTGCPNCGFETGSDGGECPLCDTPLDADVTDDG